MNHKEPSAAAPQPKLGISRAKNAKTAKEKNYSGLGALGARHIRIRGCPKPEKFAQAAEIVTDSSTKVT